VRYKSDIFETIHENAIANFEIGAISQARMREYDEMCLAQEDETDEVEEPVAMEAVIV